ncbi:Lipoprotein YhcN [Lentibacillus sp. JNUCC-1]|uniref:YhcN/YlaJ family sporulation lipoprotein n=1 Tax=Lentibacillus sp. JNUCC-1 TaxID=2654513 RepID=UPI0012E72743|nr:YhcN/YlaJ family sporulation lipoprotein [Lentibacillus sp. JNUCC-1]MUV36647.1 Lipoprotein YhcN [Lentibacillus sp. JNUCC-1]
MKKWINISLMLVFVLVIFAACQNTGDEDNMEQGMLDRDNGRDGVEQTRYGNDGRNDANDTDTPLMDRNRDSDMDRNNRQLNNDRNNGNNDNRYEVADEAADKIADQVDGIDSAYVLTTNNNAYVAAMLDNDNNRGNSQKNNDRGDELTDDVKKEISDIVKKVDGDIDNVYVSTNPDFIDLTNNYINDVDRGNPVEGMFDQMGNMIERLFPQNR